jgi:hypothetical protein
MNRRDHIDGIELNLTHVEDRTVLRTRSEIETFLISPTDSASNLRRMSRREPTRLRNEFQVLAHVSSVEDMAEENIVGSQEASHLCDIKEDLKPCLGTSKFESEPLRCPEEINCLGETSAAHFNT